MFNMHSLRKKRIVFYLILLMLLVSCVQIYQRYYEADYLGQPTKAFTIIEEVLKESEYILNLDENFLDKDQIISAVYYKYNSTIERRIKVVTAFRGKQKEPKKIQFLFIVSVPNLEKSKRKVIDKEFENLFNKILSSLDKTKIKITKKR